MGDKKKTNIPESLRGGNQPLKRPDQNALMALAFGIISVALSCAGYGAIFGIFAIVFGGLGLKSETHRKQAVAGIVLGILSIVLMIIVFALEAVNGNV